MGIPPRFAVDKEEIAAASTLLRSLCAVRDADMMPSDRFELAQTSSQEVGWVHRVGTEPLPCGGPR
jgi:hypothetical protein